MEFKEEYIATEGKDPVTTFCTYVDAVYTLALTFDHMLAYNKEFEDPYAFRETAEGTKFTGCTGRVFFEKGTNDRGASVVAVMNIIDDETGVWHMKIPA